MTYPASHTLDWLILLAYACDDGAEPWAVCEVAWDLGDSEYSPTVREAWDAVLRLDEAGLVAVGVEEPSLEWSTFVATDAGRAIVAERLGRAA